MRRTMHGLIGLPLAASMWAAAAASPDAPRPGLEALTPERRAAHAAYEDALMAGVDASSLRAFHDLLGAEPHRAGAPGDARVIGKLTSAFIDMGLEVETFWFETYLPEAIDAELEITSPERIELAVHEPPAPGDEFSARRSAWLGWNGYSASAEAAGRVVYANYGRKEDFERLRTLGVDCRDAIVIARYGGNYRGYKAKYAEAAGAAGLVLYTDPQDSGYARGLPYPEGGYANEHSIQRGSILTLDYPGDPLTPGEPAIEGAVRLDPADVAFPTIPVQPIGWGAAQEILSRMTGAEVPDASWQGGLPFRYRLTGGDALRLRMKVEQTRRLMRTANVLGTIRGARVPEERIVLGCHHDAWGYGASDPLAGLICLMESARTFAERAAAGERPDRTITFAAWGAEEQGIIGSTEWVEANRDDLRANAVAYINLDMAAMGPNFGASAWPSLKQVIIDASRVVPQAHDDDLTVHDLWVARAGRDAVAPRVGTQGGGSDHVAFLCHVGVPSISLGAGGARGVSYHSAYDTLHWYRKIVGDEYQPAVMVTRMTNVVTARLAEADVIPFEAWRPYEALARAIGALREHAVDAGADGGAIDLLVATCDEIAGGLREAGPGAFGLAGERWLTPETGPPGRAWYRNRFVAPDPTSGYGAWVAPALREAVESGDAARVAASIAEHQALLGGVLRDVRAAGVGNGR